MSEAVPQDVVMTERALRIEAHHVEGASPSLCYVAVYQTDKRGQWRLWSDATFGPFDGKQEREELETAIGWLVSQLLR